MKSSIKIDFIDRGTGKGIEPVIRVEIIKSEDPRDTLIQHLFESIGEQQFLQLHYSNHRHTVTQGDYPDISKSVLLFKPEIDTDEIASIVRMAFNEWLLKQKYTLFSGGVNGLYLKDGEEKTTPEEDLFKEFMSIKANHTSN